MEIKTNEDSSKSCGSLFHRQGSLSHVLFQYWTIESDQFSLYSSWRWEQVTKKMKIKPTPLAAARCVWSIFHCTRKRRENSTWWYSIFLVSNFEKKGWFWRKLKRMNDDLQVKIQSAITMKYQLRSAPSKISNGSWKTRNPAMIYSTASM